MKVFEYLKSLLTHSEPETESPAALAGVEAHTKPLSTQQITYMFCKVADLLSAQYLVLFSEELNVADTVVSEGIETMIKDMPSDLCCCIEYPYIDEVYRDTYYNFYSRKHGNHGRYCFKRFQQHHYR